VMSLPAMSLGDWFSVGRKGRWVGTYTQRVKTACGFGYKKSLSGATVQMVLANCHRTSQGLHAVFKYN